MTTGTSATWDEGSFRKWVKPLSDYCDSITGKQVGFCGVIYLLHYILMAK